MVRFHEGMKEEGYTLDSPDHWKMSIMADRAKTIKTLLAVDGFTPCPYSKVEKFSMDCKHWRAHLNYRYWELVEDLTERKHEVATKESIEKMSENQLSLMSNTCENVISKEKIDDNICATFENGFVWVADSESCMVFDETNTLITSRGSDEWSHWHEDVYKSIMYDVGDYNMTASQVALIVSIILNISLILCIVL